MLDQVAPDFHLVDAQVNYLSGHANFAKLDPTVKRNVSNLLLKYFVMKLTMGTKIAGVAG
jgi:hypothetical protein